MMYEIPIDKLPAQTLGVTLANAAYIITLRSVQGLVLADIEIDGKAKVKSAKCLPNHKILPYKHLTKGGNFYFYCQDHAYPDYKKFGEDHKLYFLTDDEIAALPELKDLELNG